MSKRKSKKVVPTKADDNDEICKIAREARVRASKMTPEERNESFNRAMQIIYGASPVNDSVGPGH
jgi:hypothetical protein